MFDAKSRASIGRTSEVTSVLPRKNLTGWQMTDSQGLTDALLVPRGHGRGFVNVYYDLVLQGICLFGVAGWIAGAARVEEDIVGRGQGGGS